jgi:hypothetical protein
MFVISVLSLGECNLPLCLVTLVMYLVIKCKIVLKYCGQCPSTHFFTSSRVVRVWFHLLSSNKGKLNNRASVIQYIFWCIVNCATLILTSCLCGFQYSQTKIFYSLLNEGKSLSYHFVPLIQTAVHIWVFFTILGFESRNIKRSDKQFKSHTLPIHTHVTSSCWKVL